MTHMVLVKRPDMVENLALPERVIEPHYHVLVAATPSRPAVSRSITNWAWQSVILLVGIYIAHPAGCAFSATERTPSY